MPVPHSSTPWRVSSLDATIILDATQKGIVDVRGTNEMSIATAAHIVRCVNEWHEGFMDAENERMAGEVR